GRPPGRMHASLCTLDPAGSLRWCERGDEPRGLDRDIRGDRSWRRSESTAVAVHRSERFADAQLLADAEPGARSLLSAHSAAVRQPVGTLGLAWIAGPSGHRD